VALPALGTTIVLFVAITSVDPSALGVLPALALVLLLALRRYPGELTLVALCRAREGPRRGASPTLTGPRLRRGPAVPRGGLLLACSLANRPPPGALPATR
jgi:hypothetical protein